jgi:hypothetical protein
MFTHLFNERRKSKNEVLAGLVLWRDYDDANFLKEMCHVNQPVEFG